MSKRLGETLIERGVIDEGLLRMALDLQQIYGGHLGTCFVELGVIDLDTLGQTLADSFNVAHAGGDVLDGIPKNVIGMLPKSLVEKHFAIPFEVEDRTLRAAMVDPRNLLALDELSFASGCNVEAWVAPEILVVRAMELYYGVSRRLRHIAVSGGTPRPALRQAARPAAVPAVRAPTTTAADAELATAAPPAASATPAVQAKAAQPPAVRVEDVPLLKGPTFVSQELPSYQHEATNSLLLDWIKIRPSEDEPPRWCNLFTLDLDHRYFGDLEGVYVVWYNGQQPVLRVGQGSIRVALTGMRENDELIQLDAEHTIYVSWVQIESEKRAGVERYLIEMLNPRVFMHLPPVEPIEVNLPR